MQKAKHTKLVFKGEKKTKPSICDIKDTEQLKPVEPPKSDWVPLTYRTSLHGPLFLLLSETMNGCSYISHLSLKESNEMELVTIWDLENPSVIEPNDINDVFVGYWIDKEHYYLKTFKGFYIATDPQGHIEMDREAMGMQEEWTPILLSSETPLGSLKAVAFKGQYGKYLSVHIDSEDFSNRRLCHLETTAESIGPYETFLVYCRETLQNPVVSFIPKLAETQSEESFDLELERMKKYQSWKEGELKRPSALRDESDDMAERLLDRRAKIKTDKFCY